MTNPSQSMSIPDETKIKFVAFVDLFVEDNGPGPLRKLDEQIAKLSKAQKESVRFRWVMRRRSAFAAA